MKPPATRYRSTFPPVLKVNFIDPIVIPFNSHPGRLCHCVLCAGDNGSNYGSSVSVPQHSSGRAGQLWHHDACCLDESSQARKRIPARELCNTENPGAGEWHDVRLHCFTLKNRKRWQIKRLGGCFDAAFSSFYPFKYCSNMLSSPRSKISCPWANILLFFWPFNTKRYNLCSTTLQLIQGNRRVHIKEQEGNVFVVLKGWGARIENAKHYISKRPEKARMCIWHKRKSLRRGKG